MAEVGGVGRRDTELAVYLRGDDLLLNGADCYFWIHVPGTRWHCKAHPLEVCNGRWGDEPQRLKLVDDPNQWYMSWSRTPRRPASLSEVMASTHSYGFSFVGFTGEVTGRLSLGGFEISRHD